MYEAVNWPDEMNHGRFPIHFTNGRAVVAPAETIWSLLTDPTPWPSFHPGVGHAVLLDGRTPPQLGSRFETNLAGQVAFASVQEFEPITRIAWHGDPTAPSEFVAYPRGSSRSRDGLARGRRHDLYHGQSIAARRARPDAGRFA